MLSLMQGEVGVEGTLDEFSRLQDVVAIIVTHNPNTADLRHSLSEIARQVGCLVVVDNASLNLEQCKLNELVYGLDVKLEVLLQKQNIGLGAGFNAGIHVANKLGYPYMVLFDQDSVPQAGMIYRLMRAYQSLVAEGVRVAAVGPRFRDPESGSLSNFIRSSGKISKRPNCSDENETIMTDFLISSGSFLSMQAIREVGLMDESLFIDYVDVEWCLRGKSKGWSVYGVSKALMDHSLGESRKQVWLFRWRNVACHKSFRYYYIFRNSFLLRNREYVASSWKSTNLRQNILLAGYLLSLSPSRIANFKMIWRGIMDGKKRITGQMKAD